LSSFHYFTVLCLPLTKARRNALRVASVREYAQRTRQSNGRSRMTVIDLLLLLLIAGVCGSIGRAIGGYSHGGCLVSIALGFIGALLGMWLARHAGLYEPLPVQVGNQTFPVDRKSTRLNSSHLVIS